jgi:PAS domain S-box-containing protein
MIPLDTTTCESEPIRTPGAVQPHGAVLVLGRDSGVIEAASESCLPLLGWRAESILGHSFASLIGEVAAASLLGLPADGAQPLFPLRRNGRLLQLRPSHNEAGQVLIDVECADQDASRVQQVIYQCRRDLARLRDLNDIPAITANAVEVIRAITGFDRVMLYRFDSAWNGEVIAESRLDGIEPYLGLNFPASDIPRQARELFQLSRVRQIPDVQYLPSALMARADSNAVDLGRSSLRSVSPIHIEYLTNMKVRSTLVGALEVDGALWGLVSCQNSTEPKYFSPPERDALGWLFEDIAALIESTLLRERRERDYGLTLRRRRLVEAMGARDFKALMREDSGADLLGVVGADGFALLVDESLQTLGTTPAPERIWDLQRRRLCRGGDPTFYATNALYQDLAGENDARDSVAGAIFVSLRDRPGITMIWFRTERRRSVRWAGNPEQAHFVDESGRISPRKSFAQFLENIHGQSQPWTQAELDSAGELGALIEIEVQHRYKAELGILQTVLSRINEAILVTEPNFEPEQGPTVLWVSPAFERLSGYTTEELQARRADVLFGLASDPAQIARMRDHFLRREAVRAEVLRRTKSGTPFWVDMDVLPVLDPSGQVGQLISIERDITARRQMEESLRKLSTAIEQSPASVMITDLDSRIEYVNPRFTEVTGYRADEVVGHPSRLIQSGQTAPETFAALRARLDQGRIWNGEMLNRRKSGELYWEDSHVAPVKDADGRVTHYVTVAIDITERKAAEQALRESEAFVKTILDSIPQNICVLDPDGTIIAVNTAWCHFAARNDAPTLAEGATRFNYHDVCQAAAGQPDGAEATAAWQGIADVLAGRRDHFVLDYPCTAPTGQPGWFRMSAYPLQPPCRGAVVAHEDITERKLMEISLDYERTQLRTLLEAIPDLVWLKDPSGRYLTCNAAFQHALGRPLAEILGRGDADLFPADQAAAYCASDAAAIEAAAPRVSDETRTLAAAGRLAFMATVRAPMRDPGGALIGVLGIARDITERVDAEARIKTANRELAEQGRELEKRVVERTEQLRQLAVKATLAEERERQTIAADLHDDLGQMLHVARIKLGSLGRARGAAAARLIEDLAGLLGDASGLVRSLASQLSPPVLRDLGLIPALGWLADELGRVYGLKVTVTDDGQPRPLTSAQAAILFRAVRELLINVFKHAHTDRAWVEVWGEAGTILVSVADRGIGLAAAADALPVSKGFGLVSLRERITFLKGTLSIAPHPEGGTIVTLSMPLAADPEPETPP